MTPTPDVAVIVLSTAPSEEIAEHLARSLVDERLAACVNRVPGVQSTYRWEGKVETATEVLLIIKTHSACAPELTRRLQELHPYEVPEVLALPVGAGSAAYLAWIKAATARVDGS